MVLLIEALKNVLMKIRFPCHIFPYIMGINCCPAVVATLEVRRGKGSLRIIEIKLKYGNCHFELEV